MLRNERRKVLENLIDNKAQESLKIYEELLHKWQAKINLISSNTLNDSWGRHFEDSAQISNYIPKTSKKLFDLGSGAGFPGLVLAIIRPELNVTLIESDQKKCSFLKTVSRETQTPVSVLTERIEDVSCETIPDVITARALISLEGLFNYCKKWAEANPDIIFIFPKGVKADEELAELDKNWRYQCCTHQSKTDSNAKILIFTNILAL